MTDRPFGVHWILRSKDFAKKVLILLRLARKTDTRSGISISSSKFVFAFSALSCLQLCNIQDMEGKVLIDLANLKLFHSNFAMSKVLFQS